MIPEFLLVSIAALLGAVLLQEGKAKRLTLERDHYRQAFSALGNRDA